MSAPSPTNLDQYGQASGATKQRAQALRLVRYLFGREVDPALATAIAHWVVSGSIRPVLDFEAAEEEGS